MNKSTTQQVTGLILSGGRGSRIDSQDKGLLDYQGKAIVQWSIDKLLPQVDRLVINANRNIDTYQHFMLPVIQDDTLDSYQGPIAGILAVHQQFNFADDELILICPCDTPLIPNHYVALLKAAINDRDDIDVSVVHDGLRRQNLHCLIRGNALLSLTAFFNHGDRAIKRWFEQMNTVDVDLSEFKSCFTNFNRLTDDNKKAV